MTSLCELFIWSTKKSY